MGLHEVRFAGETAVVRWGKERTVSKVNIKQKILTLKPAVFEYKQSEILYTHTQRKP